MLNHQQKKISYTFMSKATELFQLIYINFGGSYSFIWENHKYYILFLNDCFRVIYIYLLKNKNETFFKFKEYKAAIELQLNKNIKFIHSDGKGEYKNLRFDRVLKKFDIQ